MEGKKDHINLRTVFNVDDYVRIIEIIQVTFIVRWVRQWLGTSNDFLNSNSRNTVRVVLLGVATNVRVWILWVSGLQICFSECCSGERGSLKFFVNTSLG